MFAHIHRDGLRELELERAQVHQHAETDQVSSMVLTLREGYRKMLDAIIVKLKADTPDPEVTFRNGLAALELLQQFRFVVDNLLESLKRDDSLHNSMMRTCIWAFSTSPPPTCRRTSAVVRGYRTLDPDGTSAS